MTITTKRNGFLKASLAGAFAASLVATTPAASQDVSSVVSDALGIPQIDAFLPLKYDVAETEALPIDGIWMISTIRKRIKIEKGRAYAVDPWLHLFTLKVQRDMVVVQNFERLAAGHYQADDLPLMGKSTLRLMPDGNLSVSVAGMLGPANFRLIRQQPDNAQAFQQELNIATGRAQEPAPTPAPVPAPVPAPAPTPGDGDTGQTPPHSEELEGCETVYPDPDTGALTCYD